MWVENSESPEESMIFNPVLKFKWYTGIFKIMYLKTYR